MVEHSRFLLYKCHGYDQILVLVIGKIILLQVVNICILIGNKNINKVFCELLHSMLYCFRPSVLVFHHYIISFK